MTDKSMAADVALALGAAVAVLVAAGVDAAGVLDPSATTVEGPSVAGAAPVQPANTNSAVSAMEANRIVTS